MSAKRYDPLSISGEIEMIEFLEGEYVKYEDYKGERVKYLAMLKINEILAEKIREDKL